MKRNSVAIFVTLAGLLLAAAILSGCRGGDGVRKYIPGFLKKRPAPGPPAEESFRRAAEAYFIGEGYEKAGDGRYTIRDEGAQGTRTEILEWQPTRIIEYSHPTYRYQGIVGRKTVTRGDDDEVIRESPFIMYWDADGERWEHLFGTEIPQPGD